MIKKILLGLGGTAYTPAAIVRAVDLAARHGAALTAATVLPSYARAGLGSSRDPQAGAADGAVPSIESAVAQTENACKSAGLSYRIEQEEDGPFHRLIALSRSHDLTVFGLQSLFRYDMVEDPRDALAKLLVEGAKPILAVSSMPHPMRRILVAYNGSPESSAALRAFLHLRLWPDISLRIIHFGAHEDSRRNLLCEAAELCRAHGFDPFTQIVAGQAKDRLLPYAEKWGADLIVLGSATRKLLLRHAFGETALQAIRHSTRSLFLSN